MLRVICRDGLVELPKESLKWYTTIADIVSDLQDIEEIPCDVSAVNLSSMLSYLIYDFQSFSTYTLSVKDEKNFFSLLKDADYLGCELVTSYCISSIHRLLPSKLGDIRKVTQLVGDFTEEEEEKIKLEVRNMGYSM
jgi:hypothetical protein